MPAPWYRKGRTASCCCNEGASSLSLQVGPELFQPAAEPRLRPELLSEPVADVLEWLRRYDFQEEEEGARYGCRDEEPVSAEPSGETWGALDDVCDEFVREESTRDGSEVPSGSNGDIHLQVPKRMGSPARDPGRLLQPGGPSPERPSKPAAAAGKAAGSEEADKGLCPCEQEGPLAAPSLPGSRVVLTGCSLPSSGSRPGRDFFEEEEEEWEIRKRKSGTVGRLVVYRDGESPKEDIVLRGGGRHHIVVAGLREGGQASKVGVRAGDRLASIDGKKDFAGQPASAVQEGLAAPSLLVFVGFVGKLQAEVRLARVEETAGIPARGKVVFGLEGSKEFQLCEQRVFDVGRASIFLTVQDPKGSSSQEASPPPLPGQPPPGSRPIFELQRLEANWILKCAMRRIKKNEESEAGQAAVATPALSARAPLASRFPGPAALTAKLPNNGEPTGAFAPPAPRFGATLRV